MDCRKCKIWTGRLVNDDVEQTVLIKSTPKLVNQFRLIDNEIRIYEKIGKHDHIVSLYRVVEDCDHVYFCYELGTPI
jgi:serine/threonine protein kinase